MVAWCEVEFSHLLYMILKGKFIKVCFGLFGVRTSFIFMGRIYVCIKLSIGNFLLGKMRSWAKNIILSS